MAASSWNTMCLRPPKKVLCPYTALQLIDLGDLKKIAKSLNSMLFYLNDNTSLRSEMAFFDRLHYKLRNVFKSDKQMQGIRMVRNCLRRFWQMKIGKYCKEVKKDIDHFTLNNLDSKHAYLPARCMFLYILIRLQGMARLIVRAVIYLQETFYFVLQRTYIGHYANMNVLLLTTISKLWVNLRAIVFLSRDWYGLLKPFAFKLKEAPTVLDNDSDIYNNISTTDLPASLTEWLGEDFKIFIDKKIVAPLSDVSKSLDILSDGQVNPELVNCDLMALNDPGEPEESDSDVDIGVALTRDEYKEETNQSKIKCSNSSSTVRGKGAFEFSNAVILRAKRFCL